MARPLVQFQPLGRKTEPRKGMTLLEMAGDLGIAIESVCGSTGKCGKCKVFVRSGGDFMAPPTESELRTLGGQAVKTGARLACQARIKTSGNIVVEVPQESQRGHHRLLATGIERKVKLHPGVRKVLLKIPPATMKDLRADDDRLLEVLQKKAKKAAYLSPGTHGHLPDALRGKNWVTTVTLFRDLEVIRAEPGDTTDSVHGVAVDIGTTKVVAYLLDLRSGEVLATESIPNPQIPFGEDLMSRISYTKRNPDGMRKLQGVIVDGLNTLISRLCESKAIRTDEVLEVMIVGNTAMHHIFFGIPAYHLAAAPYAPAVRTSLSVSTSHLGIDAYPFGKVSSLPNIAGFVGADAVSDLLASGLYEDDKLGMMIDIGTNTEIIAGNRRRLVSCSCASGPAFEGAHIGFGMRAATGAIERVWIDPSTHEVTLRTIDDAPPKGICGSGIVDAIAELLKTGVLDPSGRIRIGEGGKRARKGKDGHAEFVLAWARDTSVSQDIVVSQKDIQEIQLAKAAIFTGVSIMMKKLKTEPSTLNRVYAAGAFGTYVDAGAAIRIGMYPDVPQERIKFIGNAAGSGARMCLKSVEMRDLAEKLSRKVEYVELAAERDFQEEFAKAMFLPHRDLSRFPSAASNR
ncbi:MAG: ASKHA domain-containing protein [Thermoplasmata archaeon]|jgi:uncharacterized 2Fe-2S/4Fe-4S cluster protein (DUF4445 family)|nr:ASKHA domain-containing protein [Thermoplasmata archaeon]